MATLPSYSVSPTAGTGTNAYGSSPSTVQLGANNTGLSNAIQSSSYIDSLYPNAYGAVPGQTQLAPNTYQQVGGIVPGLPNMTSGAASNIQNEINGTVPQSVVNQITNASAEQGVESGMPGSGLNTNSLIQSLGLNAEALTQKGTQDYLSFLTGVGSTQTNPGQAEALSQENASLAAAPNPQQAAAAQLAIYGQNQAQAAGRVGSGNNNASNPGSGQPVYNYGAPVVNATGGPVTAGFPDASSSGYYGQVGSNSSDYSDPYYDTSNYGGGDSSDAANVDTEG
jgi:hypothetical protein